MAPADYDPRALLLPVDEPPESHRHPASPTWQRRSSSRRRSNSIYSDRPPNFKNRMVRNARTLRRHAMKTYRKMSVLQRVLAILLGTVLLVLAILFLVYNERIFAMLAPVARKWRDIRCGWMILWALIFVVSFPPLIGYSSLLTIAGFVYGFPNGWFIAASATVIGSTAAFLVSRTVLKNLVHRLVAHDPRFAALALTLKHDGLKLLIMVRLCPLPYSLSNGAMSTFPTVHWANFMLAGAIASPKLLLHIFVGARLGEIAEKGGTMDAKTKAVSYLSIVIGVVAGVATGWIMYRKTRARAAQLEAEEREHARRASVDELEREYSDDPDALLAAETLRVEEDDISLRDQYAEDLAAAEEGGLSAHQPYHDEFSDEEGARDADVIVDVFKDGDGSEVDDDDGQVEDTTPRPGSGAVTK